MLTQYKQTLKKYIQNVDEIFYFFKKNIQIGSHFVQSIVNKVESFLFSPPTPPQ
jgi:hypothetical protein